MCGYLNCSPPLGSASTFEMDLLFILSAFPWKLWLLLEEVLEVLSLLSSELAAADCRLPLEMILLLREPFPSLRVLESLPGRSCRSFCSFSSDSLLCFLT